MLSKLRVVFFYLRALWLKRKLKTRQALEAWQDRAVVRFLARILPLSAFYRRSFEGKSHQSWREFPTIDKKILMANFDELNTVGLNREHCLEVAIASETSRDFTPTSNGITIGLSSGTSGNRGLFVVSPQEQDEWAGTVLAKLLPQSILSRCRIALFLRANSNLYEKTARGRIQFQFYDLLLPVSEHLVRLNESPPDVIVSPPSMLRFLADAKNRGELKIAPIKVISAAEVLDPLDEKFIQKSFGQKVHQIYQCTEGFLAATCDEGTLHLNEDVVVIQKEYLDEEKRKFSPIITDFRRRSEPMIRYRLNDVLTERKTPCPCGSVFTAIESIEGRCDDVFYVPAAAGEDLVPIFPDFVRRAVISSSDDILEYMVVQTDPMRIEVSIRCKDDGAQQAWGEIAAGFEGLFERLGCKQPTLEQGNTFQDPGVKKLRRVERRFEVAD